MNDNLEPNALGDAALTRPNAGVERNEGQPAPDSDEDEKSDRVRRGRKNGGSADGVAYVPADLGSIWRRFLIVTLIVQIATVATVATVAAIQFKLWAPIDEEAHYSYIQQVAEHGDLPVLRKSETSPEGLAIYQGTYPRPTTIDPKKFGVGGLSYEAWQPPLYYIVAAPVFAIPSNYVHKAYAVRFFDVLLLLAAVALAGRLCRLVLRERWLIGWSMTMVFFALPGVVVRFVTISYLALALPLAILFACELWLAWARHSPARLVVAGLVLGLCLLTELELLALIPVYLLVAGAEIVRRRPTRQVRGILIAVVIPFVVMAPWFAFNEAEYHMMTAGPISQSEVAPIVNPHGTVTPISQLPDNTVSLLDPVLPAEWGASLAPHPALNYLDMLLGVLIVPAGLVLVVGMGRRLWSISLAILGLPWLFTMVELWYVRFGQQSGVAARYTYPVVPILVVLVALATDTIRARFLPLLVNGAAAAAVVVIWSYLIFAYSGAFALT